MRILTLTECPHPFAEVQSLDPATGSLVFRWLNAEQQPVDSGGSVASFTPVDPLPADPEQPNASPIYPEVSDETLAAAITAAVNAEPPAPSDSDIYAGKLAEAYYDSTLEITLKCSEYAQTKFTSQFTLLQGALSAGQVTLASTVSIWDASNQEHVLTVQAFFGLILRYGFHCSNLFALYAP